MIIEARVSANAKNASVEQHDGFLKLRVRSKAQEGKANAEVIGLIAQHFHVPKKNVRILRGHSSSKKTIEIELENA